MAAKSDRFLVVGSSPHPWEREAIDFAFTALEGRGDPFQGRGLVELLDPSGSLYEIDLLVIGYSAIYVVEIKSRPGTIEGDHVEWLWTTPEGRRIHVGSPLGLTNHKCKVLRSALERTMRGRAPWVQPLIFLSDPDVQIRLTGASRTAVVGRAGLQRALVHGDFPGNEQVKGRERIPTPLMREVIQALSKLGIRARRAKLQVGEYELGAHLGDGRTYQDYEATHVALKDMRRRARIYRVPEHTSSERQAACRRQAEREVRLLQEVGQHPNILSVHAYHVTGEQGPTILFEEFAGGVTLDRFVRRDLELSLDDRIELLQQVSRAVAHCHRKSMMHGGLEPESVLVRRGEGGKVEVRLLNFQLGASELVSPTVHRTELLSARASVYQAPELAADASARGPHSDVLGLGALAFFLFTGEAPAASLEARDAVLGAVGALDPWMIRADVPEAVRDAIFEATKRIHLDRIDDADVWIESLLADLTAPERALEETVEPLRAEEHDRLAGGFTVRGVLGHGASARVLEVERDGLVYALKVSLGPEHDSHLRAEGELLQRLRHASIVVWRETREIGGRVCLLLGLAGERTLQRHLVDEGPLAVEEAIRYGEDLFDALDYLAREGVLHRDIKPGNLGIGALQKKARRLTIFDFSLVEVPLSDLKVGTDAYRDPFLRARGAWDHAADRWSAAITLHEALTGGRPGWGALGQPLPDPAHKLVLAADRFDPDARGRLIEFFEQALSPSVEERFASAREMRQAWVAAFAAPRFHPMLGANGKAVEGAEVSDAAPELRPRDLARVTPETLLGDLPLSPRARHTLERAGISRMSELLALPNNRLSAIRGVGRKVALEIFRFRDGWRELHREAAGREEEGEAFIPLLRGGDLYVVGAGLPGEFVPVLGDAGFETLQSVASAPRVQIERLMRRAGLDPRVLRATIEARGAGAAATAMPSLDGWIELFLGPGASKGSSKGKKDRGLCLLRWAFGADEPFADRGEIRARDVAAHAQVTPQRVYQAIVQAAGEWRKQAALPGLLELAGGVLEALGGAAPLGRIGEALARRLDHDEASEAAQLRRLGSVLWRILARVAVSEDSQVASGITLVEIGGGPWVVCSRPHEAAVRALAASADELAERVPLAASGEVELTLRRAVEGTPLASYELSRLADLAAAASERAARSSRNEIYPRGMAPARAVELSAQILTNKLKPAEVQARIRARYPEAAPLPEGEALHALLRPLGLRWEEKEGGVYVRAQMDALPSTSALQSSRAPTAMPGQRLARDADANEARDFEDQLKVLLVRGGLRVLQLNADLTIKGSQALIRFFHERHPDGQVVHLDRALLDQMEALLVERGGEASLLAETDAQGPEGEFWGHLTALAADAAEGLLAALVPAKAPTLLLQPGLCSRYGLRTFIRDFVERASRLDGAAVVLVVPSVDDGGAPTISGLRPEDALPLPGLLPGQRAKVPASWVQNKHQRAAAG
ncbi:MAG: protein kinase [Candidatus Eisenbacteria bacterium]|nr:protein kinase [Candidatus Eisenbacteria bacterium]